MEYVLTTDHLCKSYGHFKALNQCSMHVPRGAIYGFVGKNGAGKTTLIRLICGLQRPTSGSYRLYGSENTDKKILEAQRRIGAVVETPSIYLDMTAEENMKEQYYVLGLPSFEGIPQILKLVGLEDAGKKKAKDFSLGMRQRLGIAIALAGKPDLLVLDEPTNDLDPQGIVEMRELILKLNRERQITVLISSHILDELSRLATHYGFIDKGTIVKEITAEELENTCRKCVKLQVTDTAVLAHILDKRGLEYEILSDTQANVYGELVVSDVALELAEQNCRMFSVQEYEESLESYYLNLVGGGKHE
ncbi:MAG: ATP-binding cassette domain-containing protein [Lachnospiraceae bacterium]|nr:ATP-binding cassette domain-containing protein [Lachnospiraceae bacterium]